MRKLLPYEHQLIESLGITKEEYLEFVAIQQEYKDPKVGTALDVRNEAGTAALVLTIVGTLFQVGAALLAPKPEVPSGDARRRSRQQRFAPSSGFNSTQDLAAYGDPVNLVYTNQNPSGDVRVSGSLVWSALDNFGSTQFMRLLVVLGAGEIEEIGYQKTAFGQASLADLDRQDVFIFEDQNFNADNSGPPPFSAIKANFGTKEFFPKTLKPADDKPAFRLNTHEGLKNGFSQAYTPTTSTSLGVFDAVPINVDVKSRDKDGDEEESNISIVLEAGKKDNNKWRNSDGSPKEFAVNDQIVVRFHSEKYKPSGSSQRQPRKTAVDLRRQMADALDFGSTYMLGSSKFRLLEYNTEARNISKDDSVFAVFKCTESGQVPGTPYDEEDPNTERKDLRRAFVKAKRILSARNEDFSEDNFSVDEIIIGNAYRVRDVSQTDFTSIGANFNSKGEIFVAEKIPDNTSGEVSNASVEGVTLNELNIDFTGTEKIKWTPQFTASVSKDFDRNNGKEGQRLTSDLDEESRRIERFGSIRYTQDLKEDVGADAPTLDTDELLKDVDKQIAGLYEIIDEINGGTFDGKGTLLKCNNDYEGGFKSNPNEAHETEDLAVRWEYRNLITEALNKAPGPLLSDFNVSEDFVDTVDGYYFTFVYIDSTGRYNFFHFNGVRSTASLDTTSPDDPFGPQDFFPDDSKLYDLRSQLVSAQKQIYDQIRENTELDGVYTRIKESAREAGNSTEQGRTLFNSFSGISIEQFNTMNSLYKQERSLQEKIANRIDRLVKKAHSRAIKLIEKDIALLQQLRDEIPKGKKKDDDEREGIRDRVGTKAIRKGYKKLIRQKQKALGDINEILDDWDSYKTRFDNNFFSKCLVKAETASYTTVSECNVVNFSFKTRLFRRISGRQKKYGDQKMREYSQSDNGVKSRMVFFRMSYQEYVDGGIGNEVIVPHVIAIRHGSEADFYTQVGFFSPEDGNGRRWKFKFTPVYDILAEERTRSFTSYFFLENTDKQAFKKVPDRDEYIFWYGREVAKDSSRYFYPSEEERGPVYTNEWDMFSVNSDTQVQFSFESGPEIQLTAITEQQLNTSDLKYEERYKDLSMMGVGVFAGRGLQDLRSITALVKKGKLCRTVENPDTATSSSSYAPDIFVDTLLDKENGIGKYIEKQNIDLGSLQLAKNFCKNNNLPGGIQLFMDGVIADTGSWREFWTANAPFSLLELARKNGKETLVPALPVNASGEAAEDSGLPIEMQVSALFTTGNILEGSYKEEFLDYGAATEDLIASVIYRDYDGKELFSKNKSVEVSLKDTEDNPNAVRETFDLSQFVTQREQAVMFGKLLCNQRRHIRKAVEFKTFPSEAIVEPGAFVYVDVGLKKWDFYSSGVVMEDGVLNAPMIPPQRGGTRDFEFLLYSKDDGSTVTKSNISVTTSGGISTAADLADDYRGYLFVMGQDQPSKRVYRVTEVGIEEEGEISVKAIEYPCFEEGGKTRAHIADFRSSKFDVS